MVVASPRPETLDALARRSPSVAHRLRGATIADGVDDIHADDAEVGLRALVAWPGDPGLMQPLAAGLLARLLARRGRVDDARAVLAPVVAGTGPSAHPDIAAARRFVQGLDAAVAVTSAPHRGPVVRAGFAAVGWVVRLRPLLVVSHDPAFLDAIQTAGLELSQFTARNN